MKKSLAIVLSVAILMLSLCACGAQSEQSGSSKADNNDKSSQQIVTTEKVSTQPATEPNYENTNFIAQPPQGKPNYRINEIFSDTSSKVTRFDAYGNYIIITFDSSYDVIYDLDENMVVNFGEVAAERGNGDYGKISGIFGDYVVVELNQSKYFLYNLKTNEMRNIDFESAKLDNGVVIVCNDSKYGALDLDLNEIVPIKYEWLKIASPELFVAQKNQKYGLIDFNDNFVAEFKYKKILPFTGVNKFGINDPLNSLDFEKNINKYTVALTESDKYVLIDNKGKETSLGFEIAEYDSTDEVAFIDRGRIVSQYNGVTYIKSKDKDSNKELVTDLDSNLKANDIEEDGYINGYCICYDNSKKARCLIDCKGNTIYEQKVEGLFSTDEIYSVDQNGLFLVREHTDANQPKYKIMDLGLNEVCTFDEENCVVYPYGNGVFVKETKDNFSVYRVTAN
ncbi:MAG: hypothetical protein ACI4XI_06595 [Ruminococcus sp.]